MIERSSSEPELTVVMYHYVRDLPHTRFPKIKGLLLDTFRKQVQQLRSSYEMATLESALAFIQGDYQPSRDLCLLTFDDGLREHYAEVTPLLSELGIQGLFFLITDCIENGRVASVHMNHFLMATLEIDDYRQAYEQQVMDLVPDFDRNVSDEIAARVYRWDEIPIGKFKYLLNFRTPANIRKQVLSRIFRDTFGDESRFARELYVTWDEAMKMTAAGQIIGGHTHGHHALAKLDAVEQAADLEISTRLLRERLEPNYAMPFSYPYGKRGSAFDAGTVEIVQRNAYCCAFSTELGNNQPNQDRFAIRRIDTKDIPVH